MTTKITLKIITDETITPYPTFTQGIIQRTLNLSGSGYLYLSPATRDIITLCTTATGEDATSYRDLLEKSIIIKRGGVKITNISVTPLNQNCINISYPIGKALYPSKPLTFTIYYKDYFLLEQGNIRELHYPKITNWKPTKVQEAADVQTTIINQATVNFLINRATYSKAFVITPKNYSVEQMGDTIKLSFDVNDFHETGISILLGTQRYIITRTSFSVPQAPGVKLLNKLSNIKVLIPPSDPVYKQVTYLNPQSKPAKIVRDERGNLYAYIVPGESVNFETLSIISDNSSLSENLESDKISDIPKSVYNKWINPRLYPYNNPKIKKIAQRLKAEDDNLLQTVRNVVEFVVDYLEYEESFLSNPRPRKSVISALNTRSGVCMEYADLTITLLHALGIPARPAFGYLLYTNTVASTNLGEFGHQWVEVYFPSKGWVPVDPTIAENVENYINAPLAYLFLTRDPEFINLSCVGPLGFCEGAKIDYKIEPLKSPPTYQYLELSKVEAASTPMQSAVEKADYLLKPLVESIPLKFVGVSVGVFAAFLLLGLYMLLKKLAKRA